MYESDSRGGLVLIGYLPPHFVCALGCLLNCNIYGYEAGYVLTCHEGTETM